MCDDGHASSGTVSSEFRGTKRDHVQLSSFDLGTCTAGDSNDTFVAASPQRSNKFALHQHMARWEDDSSDEGTNSFRRRYKRAKRTDAYNGWLETSTLKIVAERYKGTASQFRVLKGVSDTKDSKRQASIPPGSLIVQSRFVSPAGNVGGQTSMFLNWRLPGKINRHPFYKDTRPWFHDAGTPLNAYPSITLESDLHQAVKKIVSTFLREAEPGMTPIEFFGKGDDLELLALFHDHCYLPPGEIDRRDRMHGAARNESAQSGAQGDGATLIFNTPSQRAAELQYLGKSIHDADNDEGAGHFDDDIIGHVVGRAHGAGENNDDPNLLDKGEDNKTRSWFPFISGQLSARSERRSSGGPKPDSPTEASFYVNSSPSSQFLVLIEGFVECEGSTVAASSDRLRESFLDEQVGCLSSNGRLVDLLPSVALSGHWLVTILGSDGMKKRVSGLIPSSMRDSNGSRIVLRHNSMRDLGMLSDNAVMTPHTGSTTRQVHVSSIDPAISRCKHFNRLGMVCNDVDPFVVGSISIVACDRCSSRSDANSERAGDLANAILLSCKGKASELSVNGVRGMADVESLVPITATKGVEGDRVVSTNLGVSYRCNLTSTEHYIVLVGQDDEGRTVAVDGKSQH
jgi:hypothetical protein